MNQQKDDKILWQRIQKGDETAFKVLFKKYYKTLSYSAYKVYADEHKAKDFVQEVFLDLWKKREVRDIKTSLYGFLKKAVFNKSIDYIRAQRFDFEEEVEMGNKKHEPYQEMEYEELQKLIYRTAEQLPKRCRIVFFMSRFEDLSHKEIAEQLGISTKTVENQITKALKVLREVVTPYLSDDLMVVFFFLLCIGDDIF